ncbi:MAG: radical SAM protein [Candidatus Thermoplasmatota archaeon]|nr:radical SAM protein [Candidatus Thermoplasmatota archaeon]
MNIKEITVQRLINKITKKDTLFHGSYTLDPYQNCTFGCIYCDSALDDTIYIKYNAIDILEKEVAFLPKDRIIIGSVHDPYQPVEEKYQLTHQILTLLSKSNHPVHILTKSTSILNDLYLIKKLNNPIVTFTILDLDEILWRTVEPNTPSPQQRLETMETLAEQGITTGLAIIPTLPHLKTKQLKNLILQAKDYQAAYILHKPLFLQGEQKILFLERIKKSYPTIYQTYCSLFHERRYPPGDYTTQVSKKIRAICLENDLPIEIPDSKR